MTVNDTPAGTEKKVSALKKRSAARLSAVQALYEMDVSHAGADPVLREFMQRRWSIGVGDGDDTLLVEPDQTFLIELVRGVTERLGELDKILGSSLRGEWTVERLEVLLRAVLRAGTLELVGRPDIPAKVVISEYLEVSHAFFSGSEPSLVNGVLDRIAHVVRGDEF
ncbi:transcription antitermination factor NusB [Varunaivibrio sulfuroxidans]|uniref:Transcription antitermination protein NusB n=1 Tax=Varunaivibrio sulfuroxidans TaxID=1773489 RepID=A0A4R3JEN1_9PROT|nr:transcription antitermination factor NusB [Varunaivibrio sulfuroxidans]TCS64264.1 NusB antitermination factor [Varunaivibrio sulfuroxidans]WES31298.1 transcription antitermination factor NusB [Varunaivibrio sulfuroxidans]